jgi:hypothetical protein
MEILAVGWQDPNWCKEIECKGCGAVLRVERGDVKARDTDGMSGHKELVVFNCIGCSAEITLVEFGCHAQRTRQQCWGDLPKASKFPATFYGGM